MLITTGLWFHLHFIVVCCDVGKKLGCYEITKIPPYVDIGERVTHRHLAVLLTFLPTRFCSEHLPPVGNTKE